MEFDAVKENTTSIDDIHDALADAGTPSVNERRALRCFAL